MKKWVESGGWVCFGLRNKEGGMRAGGTWGGGGGSILDYTYHSYKK